MPLCDRWGLIVAGDATGGSDSVYLSLALSASERSLLIYPFSV
jgi:hypothetical protein